MSPTEFWDALAPLHSAIENNYFDLASARQIAPELRAPVLVVGAGQGLIVAELRKKGLPCDGVDFSPEMVRQAKLRRGLELVQADAAAMPFAHGTYGTLLYATGVIDFTGDEQAVRTILNEGRRVVKLSGRIFVAFYRLSDASEQFLARVGLLREGVLSHRECLQMYLLNPAQMIRWVANRAGGGWLTAIVLLLRMSARGTMREKLTTLKMQRIFRNREAANALLQAAPEKQPYRNELGIRKLFERLEIPLKEIRRLATCWIVEIAPASCAGF